MRMAISPRFATSSRRNRRIASPHSSVRTVPEASKRRGQRVAVSTRHAKPEESFVAYGLGRHRPKQPRKGAADRPVRPLERAMRLRHAATADRLAMIDGASRRDEESKSTMKIKKKIKSKIQ